jgi:hypothetical protein
MTRTFRLFYFIGIIIVFTIITAIIIVYASGWRFNFSAKHLQKVGAITIETNPRDAQIILNNKLLPKNTPTTITNLLPQVYTLKIVKNGYYDWSTTINVQSGQALRFDSIYLIKKQESPRQFSFGPFTQQQLSPNGNFLAVVNDRLLSLWEIDTGGKIYSSQFNQKITSVLWSPTNNYLIAKADNNNFILLDISSSPVETNLNDYYALTISDMAWSSMEDSIIYVRTTDGLFRLNVIQKTKSLISVDQNVHYFTQNLFYKLINNILYIQDIQGTTVQEITLHANSQLIIEPIYSDIIGIRDTINKQFLIINTQNNTHSLFDEQVSNFSWSKTSRLLLVSNTNELWSWDITTDEKKLIFRTSDQLINIGFILKEHYLLINQEKNGLQAIEFMGFGKNTYTIYPFVPSLLFIRDENTVITSTNNQIQELGF